MENLLVLKAGIDVCAKYETSAFVFHASFVLRALLLLGSNCGPSPRRLSCAHA